MSKTENDEFRVVVFKEGDTFIAQCLEYDICAQAGDVKTLRHRMDATIEAERDFARSNGKTLIESIDPAPKHFFDMWDKAWGAAQETGVLRLALCA